MLTKAFAQPVVTLRSSLGSAALASIITALSSYWFMIASRLPVVKLASAAAAMLVASAAVTAGCSPGAVLHPVMIVATASIAIAVRMRFPPVDVQAGN